MTRKIIGFIFFLLVGSVLIIAYYFARPYLHEKKERDTSDAGATSGTVTIGVDNWIGYFPLCGKEMKKRMRSAGYLLKCVDDNAAYAQRMKDLKSGSLDFAVATVDSYILNGAPERYPGAVVMVIDESKGGDAIVARKDRVKSLDALKTMKDYKIAFTPSSPSEYLLKSVSVHFDIPELRERQGKWRMETSGSPEALAKLVKKEADVAVVWEPDVSRALAKDGFVKLLGTADTKKLIVDLLLVNRDYAEAHPDVVPLVLTHYFRALKWYRDNPERFSEEVEASTRLSSEQVQSMLKGVEWATLNDNAQKWFGVNTPGLIAEEGLIDTIESTVDILISSGDFKSNPLPEADPYRLKNRRYIEALFEKGIGDGAMAALPGPNQQQGDNSLERKFETLTPEQWENLSEIGTLKVRPITFQSGTSDLSYEGKLELDKAAANLQHYPNFRVVVKGHSGLKGDMEANKRLSQERADTVKRYFTVTYNVSPERVRAVGYGAEKPLPRLPGESDRALNYRLPRVELYLVSEVY